MVPYQSVLDLDGDMRWPGQRARFTPRGVLRQLAEYARHFSTLCSDTRPRESRMPPPLIEKRLRDARRIPSEAQREARDVTRTCWSRKSGSASMEVKGCFSHAVLVLVQSGVGRWFDRRRQTLRVGCSRCLVEMAIGLSE